MPLPHGRPEGPRFYSQYLENNLCPCCVEKIVNQNNHVLRPINCKASKVVLNSTTIKFLGVEFTKKLNV